MRLKSLANKEVIDIVHGEKLGVLGRADLIIDPSTGEIEALIILNDGLMGVGSKRKELTMNWDHISKIGEDTILLHKPI